MVELFVFYFFQPNSIAKIFVNQLQIQKMFVNTDSHLVFHSTYFKKYFSPPQLKLSSHYSDLTCLADTLRTRMPLSSQHILPRPRSIPSQTWNGSLESDQRSLSELEKVFLYVSDGQTNTATISVLHKSVNFLRVTII